MSDEEIRVAILEEKVRNIELMTGALQADLREKFDRLEVKLDMALKGKVSWIMTFVLTALSTISTALIVYILTTR